MSFGKPTNTIRRQPEPNISLGKHANPIETHDNQKIQQKCNTNNKDKNKASQEYPPSKNIGIHSKKQKMRPRSHLFRFASIFNNLFVFSYSDALLFSLIAFILCLCFCFPLIGFVCVPQEILGLGYHLIGFILYFDKIYWFSSGNARFRQYFDKIYLFPRELIGLGQYFPRIYLLF